MTLKEHTVKSYDKEIQSIAATLEEIMHLVVQSVDMVSDMIKQSDEANYTEDFLEKIITHDYKINSLDLLIERKVTTMLALRQPMAVDLRYIVSALKVSSNLERVGDQAKSIIKKINSIGQEAFKGKVKDSILEMAETSKVMVHDAVISFNSQNHKLAEEVLKKDDEVDRIYGNLFELLESDSLSKAQAKKVISTLFIAKSFERLADHSTNVAEITQYVITGEAK